MKFLLNELNKYVYLSDKTEKELINIFTSLAYEVESIYPASQIKDVNLRVVEECIKHPNADSLNFLYTKINGEKIDVVCGASNISSGQIVAHAAPGSKVGDIIMAPKNLRGIVSNGMILSISEIIGIHDSVIEYPENENIFVFPEDIDINDDIVDFLELSGNIFDLSILPDRQYSSSYFAMAREVAAFIDREYKWNIEDIKRNNVTNVEINLGTNANAVFVTNVTLNENIMTPFWIKRILYHSGIKPTNTIEDVTAYSMLMTGAVTYVTDRNNSIKLEGRKLNELDIFESTSLVSKSNKVQLITIASSMRSNFVREKNINQIFGIRTVKGTTTEAAELTSRMVIYVAMKAGFIKDVFKTTSKFISEEREFIIEDEYIFNFLGQELDLDVIAKKLELIDIKKIGNKYIIPSYRSDIEFKADIVEEIVRFFGVENIIPKSYEITKDIIEPEIHKTALINITNELVKYGLVEIKSYQLITKEQAEQFNIWSMKNFIELTDDYSLVFNTLRTSLFSGLLESLKLNHRNNKIDIRLYELGNVFYEEEPTYSLGILHDEIINKEEPILATKELVIRSLSSIGIDSNMLNFKLIDINLFNPYISSEIIYKNNRIGLIGEIHPRILREHKFIRLDKVRSKLYYAEIKLGTIFND